MSPFDIYQINLSLSKEFASLDALYQVFANRQEESWEKWWEYAQTITARKAMAIERQMAGFISKKINVNLFRPAVIASSGIIAGNQIAFLCLFHEGATDFIDLVG